METIMNYLDNMFATLPKTKQIKDLRNDLLTIMEDKYNELKRSGKSENEAVGIVISEFGNIDEIIEEYDVKIQDKSEELPTLTEDEVNDYLEANKKMGILTGIGVMLCILGAALFILITQLVDDGLIAGLTENNGDRIGLISLLILIAIAAGIFIYASMIMDKYKHIENSFELPTHVRLSIENKKDSFHTTYTRSVIIGVMLCILSPIALFITLGKYDNAERYGIVILLFIISMATHIFIYYGSIMVSYKKLLKIEEYSTQGKENK